MYTDAAEIRLVGGTYIILCTINNNNNVHGNMLILIIKIYSDFSKNALLRTPRHYKL